VKELHEDVHVLLFEKEAFDEMALELPT